MNPVTLKPRVDVGDSSRIRFKRILFATDLGPSSAWAQAYALMLAQMFGSHLYILYVETGPGLSARYQKAFRLLPHRADQYSIAELTEFFRASKVPFTVLVEPGEVPDVLNQVVGKNDIDLIVLGTHGRKGISHALMGSMAENVSRSSSCPVITVGPQVRSGFENSLRKIVYATDFSEASRSALPHAISLAQEFHAELSVLHVAPHYMIHDRRQVEAYLMNRLINLAPQSRFPWCTLRHIVDFGNPATRILKVAAEEEADLIVIGLHGFVQFTSHFPDRLSYSIVCDASCPVMSVLPEARELKLAMVPNKYLDLAGQMN